MKLPPKLRAISFVTACILAAPPLHSQDMSRNEIVEALAAALANERQVLKRQSFDYESSETALVDERSGTAGFKETAVGSHIIFDTLSRSSRQHAAFDDKGASLWQYTFLSTFDNSEARLLKKFEGVQTGFIDPEPLGESVLSGHWLMSGELYGISEEREGVPRSSLLSMFEERAAHDGLTATRTVDDMGSRVVVAGSFSWGRAQIVLDPTRNYSVVGIDALIEPVPVYNNAESLHYKLDEIELEKTGGHWIPKTAVMETTAQFEGEKQIKTLTKIEVSNSQILDEKPPISEFSIEFPPNVVVSNRIHRDLDTPPDS